MGINVTTTVLHGIGIHVTTVLPGMGINMTTVLPGMVSM